VRAARKDGAPFGAEGAAAAGFRDFFSPRQGGEDHRFSAACGYGTTVTFRNTGTELLCP
jgi:hypothetical protein